MDVHFYFDVMCPWTWLTSRWLVDVAAQRDLTVTWRTLSLPMLHAGPASASPVPDAPRWRSPGELVLRVMESLRADGRNDDVGRFYTECGRRFHVEGQPPAGSVIVEAARAAGVVDHLAAADDDTWDVQVRASLIEALVAAGPDVGSPVMVIDGQARGVFGPIVSPRPEGEDAVRLWDAMVTLLSTPGFLEAKRGRTAPPAIPGT